MNNAQPGELPNRNVVLNDFLKRHLLDKKITGRMQIPIYWASCALTLLNDGCTDHSERLSQEPTWALLWNMVHRASEQVEGAVVALLTGCGAPAEVVSRAAIELSVSISYILVEDRRSRLISYFTDYVDRVSKDVKNWRAVAEKMSPPDRDIHLKAIHTREHAKDALAGVVDRLRVEFGQHLSTPSKPWPDISKRFQGIGKESGYRTVYARLCSQTHGDAEETLRYFLVMSVGDEKLLERAGIETWEFSRLMVLLATSFFLSAVRKYGETFGITDLASPLKLASQELDKEMKLVALNVGAF